MAGVILFDARSNPIVLIPIFGKAQLFEKGGDREMRIPFMKALAWYLAAVMLVIAVAPRVDAGFAPSSVINATSSSRAADLDSVRQALETKMVRERLEQFGLSSEEIDGRLSQLSDEQLHQLALQIDELRVGGDAAGVIIAILVIILLVVLIIHFTGHKVIVTK